MSTRRASRTAAQWALDVAAWRKSGQLRRDFAIEHGLSEGTLGWWCKKLRQRGDGTNVHPVRLAELVVESKRVVPDLVVDIVGRGLCVQVPFGFDAAELRRLVGALC